MIHPLPVTASQYSSPVNRAEKIHFCAADSVWVFDGIPVEVISCENYNWFPCDTNYRGNKVRMLTPRVGRFPPVENKSVWTCDIKILCVQCQFLTSQESVEQEIKVSEFWLCIKEIIQGTIWKRQQYYLSASYVSWK